ncbi:hypothetical protein DPMN_075823 [Dreissena polymorpha]|uniref:Uncharacterized protein n=1 Tax=Dreissena polymorpha TaxID=45954 RepID=A0A9D3YHZ0_DREPO|nr:hypothetical protein DPMN_075823 [Dreissena polymorpha]
MKNYSASLSRSQKRHPNCPRRLGTPRLDQLPTKTGKVGIFGIGETNDRGLRLLEFARSHQHSLTNTLHQHKPSSRQTCYKQTSSQTDRFHTSAATVQLQHHQTQERFLAKTSTMTMT